MKIKIKERNPVTSQIITDDPTVIPYLRKVLGYNYTWYEQGPFSKEKKTQFYPVVSAKGIFLSGFIDRVAFLLIDKYEFVPELDCPDYGIEPDWPPYLVGITLREDQEKAVNEMTEEGGYSRGVWQAPTGSGKTVLIGALCSCFSTPTLIIVHTSSLFEQTYEELKKFFPDEEDEIGRFGCGYKEVKEITIGMIQTLAKVDVGMFFKDYGMIIVDEAHHVNNLSGTYANVLKRLFAPVRFGFTATLPNDQRGQMALEGLIGPTIGRTTYTEMEKREILAKPKLKFYAVPESDTLKDELKGTYDKVYQKGIVENRTRNKLILDKAAEQLNEGKTVLIMVERVEHGEILREMSKLLSSTNVEFVFLHGDTDKEIVEEQKRRFENGETKAVIATRIWSEGVNIRSVGCVVNAVGGESEIAVIQRFGRGLRKAEGKEDVILIDFIDQNHKWFIKHSLKRVVTYSEWGWL